MAHTNKLKRLTNTRTKTKTDGYRKSEKNQMYGTLSNKKVAQATK